VREALGSSYNIVAVKVLQRVGLPAFLDMARRLGISSLDSVSSLGLAATLGGGEVSLLELTVAYAVLANNGLSVRPYAIERVTDAGGRVLWQAPVYRDRQVISPQVAYLITDILSDDRARIPTFGEASVLALTRPAAVKTGTTTNFRDNWTVGYTPQMAVGVWVGNAGGGSMGRVSGVMGAAPVWHRVMEVLHRRLPVAQFAEPSGMVHLEVCAESGLLPGPYCPHRRRELFVAGTQPTSACDMHVQLAVDRRTGYLAGATTPPGDIAERIYTVLPADALAWGDERGLPRPPLAAPGGAARQGGPILISSPPANAVYAMAADLPAWSQRVEFATAVGAGEPIAEVRLLVDAVAVATLTEAPYRTTWRLEPGDHTFSAEAETLDGRVYRSAITRVKVVRG